MEEINNKPDFTPNTHPVLQALNEKVTELENELSLATAKKDALQNSLDLSNTNYQKAVDKYRTAEYSLTSVLKELLDDEDITFENATKIADIFDSVTLTKVVMIRYELHADVELEVPYGSDVDDIAGNTYIDRVTAETYESDVEVLEVDFDVSDYRVVM